MNRPVLPLATLALLLAVAAPAWAQRGDPSADFVTVQKSRGATAATVAAELQRTYREPADRIATLLIGAGYRPAPVLTTMVMDLRFPLASATEDVGRGGASVVEYEPSEAEQMAQTLADGDYSASAVADVLVQLYDASAEEVVTALRSAGYGDDQVVLALVTVFNYYTDIIIETLRAVGDSCSDAFLRARAGADGPPEYLGSLVVALHSSGCTRTEVKNALWGSLSAEYMALQLAVLLEP